MPASRSGQPGKLSGGATGSDCAVGGGQGEINDSTSARGLAPLRAALALLLLALAAVCALPGTAKAQTTTTVWTATMTVGELDLNGIPLRGFIDAATDTGELAQKTFTWPAGGTDYSISQLFIIADDANPPLRFKLSPSGQNVFNSAEYKLVIGSTEFSFADAAFQTTQSRFTWSHSGLSWADGATVAVKITRTVADPPPTLESAVVLGGGGAVTLVFDEDLDLPSGATLPAALANAFTITADGNSVGVNAAIRTSNSRKQLTLTLPTGTRIYQGQTVKLAYNKTTAGDDALKNTDDEEVESFTDFAVTNNSTQVFETSGTVEISVASATVTEGSAGSPGNKTVTWTLTATTAEDTEPESALDFQMRVRTRAGSATEDDYEAVNETVRFRGSETWTRRNTADGFRYVLRKSGTVTVVDDPVVETEEEFELRVETTSQSGNFTVGSNGTATVTVEDEDRFGVGMTVSPDVIGRGETTDVTVTFRMLDGAGAPQGGRNCIVPYTPTVDASIAGTATSSDYSHTVTSGSLTGNRFAACQATVTAVLRVTAPAGAVIGRTITFTPALTASDPNLNAGLLRAATLTIQGAVPARVTGLELSPGNGRIAVSWREVSGATGYLVEWKSGGEDYAPARRRNLSGESTVDTTVTGLVNGTEYTVRVRARNDEGDGPASAERRATPTAAASLTLASLTATGGVLSPSFSPGNTRYTLEAAPGTGAVTLAWTLTDPSASVEPSPADADPRTQGHQVSLTEGETTVRLRVRYGPEMRDYTVRVVLVSDRPVVTFERVTAEVTEGEDAEFRLRLLTPWRSDVTVVIWARDTSGLGQRKGTLASNPLHLYTFSPGREREYEVVFKTRDDDWREAPTDIVAWVAGHKSNKDGLFVVNDRATVRVLDNDAGERVPPDVPQYIEAIGGDGRVTLAWGPPQSDGGSRILRYEYRAQRAIHYSRTWVLQKVSSDPPAVQNNAWVSIPAGATSYAVTGLSNRLPQGQLYIFQLRAVNAEGAGEATYQFGNRPNDHDRHLPGMPRNVAAVANDDGSVTLSWDAPAARGNAPVERYEYAVSPERTANPLCHGCKWTSTGSAATSVTVTHRNGRGPDDGERLENGLSYAFLVRAVNASGNSYITNIAWATPVGGSDTATHEDATIAGLTIGDAPGGRWDPGEAVRIEVGFSRAVTVDTANGTPSIGFVLGSEPRTALYAEGSGSETLAFEYTLTSDDSATDTVLIAPDALALNGGTIRAGGVDAVLTHVGAGTGGAPLAPPSSDPLTASLDDRPDAHDGETPFEVRVAFSEDITTSFRDLDDGFAVSGGEITSVRRVEKQSDLWELKVEPSGDAGVVFTLEGGRACSVTGAPCTSDGRTLSETLTFTVPGPDNNPSPIRPLNARIDHAPAEHDGSSQFEVRVEFSEPIANSFRHVDDAATVSGGAANSAKRVDKQNDMWNLRVVPDGNGPVTVTLAGGGTCGEDHPAVLCTADGRELSHTVSVTVPGPAAFSVADARAHEDDGSIEFTVSLDRAALKTITVDYATEDGSAAAGEDYTETSDTLTFDEGDETKTVLVALLPDAIDEGEETFTLKLSNAVGARIEDATATGTIENDDPLQKAWLARFGRTVASQVVDAVSDRLSGPLAGAQVTLGGQSVDFAQTEDEAWVGQALTSVARALGAAESPEGEGDGWPGPGLGGLGSPAAGSAPARGMSGRELLLGSAFHLAADGEGGGPGLAAWGRVTVGGFDAEVPADAADLRIDGDVTTGILGADAAWSRLLAGVAVSVSEGEGTFDQPGVDNGTIESTMTTVSPYARLMVNDRVSVWGLAGWGTGDMTIVQAANDRGQPERVTRTDLEMRLAAAGGRGALLQADETGGIDLALKADAFFVETEAEAVSNEGGTTAQASRVRLALEGGRAFALGGGATLRPSLELGLRHDGGDAETGTGVELGGGVSYADPASGLSVEVQARMLVAHADSDYEEWGVSGSVRLAPGERGRGLSFSLSPTVGAASSAAERLWGARRPGDFAPGGGVFEASRGLDAELGYGLGVFGDRFTGTPNLGLRLSDAARDYRIGWRLTSAVPGDPGFEVNLDATRREPAVGGEPPEHGMMLRGTVRW